MFHNALKQTLKELEPKRKLCTCHNNYLAAMQKTLVVLLANRCEHAEKALEKATVW